MLHAREKRLRRAAERQGLKVRKSRGRVGGDGHPRYWLVDPWLDAVAAGGHSGMTVDELEAYLAEANRGIRNP